MAIDVCKRLVYWGQFGPTCWFNALLMVIFYSQHSRERVIQASKTWDNKIKIFKIFKHILKYKFVKSSKPEKDIKFFERIKAEKILQLLHNYKANKFVFNPKKHLKHGFAHELYIKKFYKMLNLNGMHFTRFDENTVAYSRRNHIELNSIKITGKGISYNPKVKSLAYVQRKLKTIPDFLFIECNTSKNFRGYYESSLQNQIFKDVQLASMNDIITFNNTQYVLDSVVLSNWNTNSDFHAIAGITCNNERYVYNGWTRYTKDPTMPDNQNKKDYLKVPCELMKFHWDVKRNHDFCINSRDCKLDNAKPLTKNLCFSFNKGARLLVYVKKVNYDINMNILQTPEYISMGKSPKNCPEGKVLNPKTGRCNKTNSASIPVKAITKTSSKQCPPGKILNPKTGRCNKIKNGQNGPPIPFKKCPPGKMINPITGRCIKAKAQVTKCPPGKVLDPSTKRCILLSTAKKRKLL